MTKRKQTASLEPAPMSLADARELVVCLETIERCDVAIRVYEQAGITGTVHDIEHREMRGRAVHNAWLLLPPHKRSIDHERAVELARPDDADEVVF